MNKSQLFKRSTYLLITLLLVFSACKENEVKIDETEKELESSVLKTLKVLVFHEGGFLANNATIGAYNPNNQAYNPTAFREVNGSFIGDVQQNVISNNGLFYSVLNGSNAVGILDSASLSLISTIKNEAIDKPRDLAIKGQTAYLSNWGPYNEDFTLSNSKIVVLDLALNTVVGSIETAEGLEDVHLANNTLLVTRNYFGSYRNLTFIDTETNQIITDIELPEGPQEILEDAAGNIWVVCSSGALVNINVEETSIANTVDLDGAIFADAAIYAGAIYFFQDNEIKAYDLMTGNIRSVTTTVEIQVPYAFGVDPSNGDIYLGDGVDYSDGGMVIRYSAEGELLDEFNSGILPTQFIFQTNLVEEVEE